MHRCWQDAFVIIDVRIRSEMVILLYRYSVLLKERLFVAVHSGSPLGELHRCVKDRVRVKVHIRTFKGLRGVCSGFVMAFDKFWNMVIFFVLCYFTDF